MATGWQNIDGKSLFPERQRRDGGTTFTKDETQYTINADGEVQRTPKRKKNTGGGACTLAFLDADT
ncbi:MAG: hypothetical protein ACLR8P_15280 [Clostridium fessum]